MKFDVLYSVAIISIYCRASLAVPLLGGTPTIKVFVTPLKILASPVPDDDSTPPPGKDNLCSPAQVAAIESGITEAHVLASAAVTELSGIDGVEGSEGVVTWLGSITAADLQTQVTKRFANTVQSLAQTATTVDSLTNGDDAVYFLCPNPGVADNLCGKKNRDSNGYTGNKIQGYSHNTISFCDPFFDAGISLANDKVAYDNTVPVGRKVKVRNTFPAPKAKGSILLHEAQHCLPIMLSNAADDNLQDLGATPKACSGDGLTDDQKQDNAESWALVGFLAEVDPNRFSPPTLCGTYENVNETSGAVCTVPPSNPSSFSPTAHVTIPGDVSGAPSNSFHAVSNKIGSLSSALLRLFNQFDDGVPNFIPFYFLAVN